MSALEAKLVFPLGFYFYRWVKPEMRLKCVWKAYENNYRNVTAGMRSTPFSQIVCTSTALLWWTWNASFSVQWTIRKNRKWLVSFKGRTGHDQEHDTIWWWRQEILRSPRARSARVPVLWSTSVQFNMAAWLGLNYCLVSFVALFLCAKSLDNGLARTPPSKLPKKILFFLFVCQTSLC